MLYHHLVPYAGTYWYHPHVGLQLDRCLYGPFLVDDPSRPRDCDSQTWPAGTVADHQLRRRNRFPGHCHNLYHQQAGMMTVLSYRT